MLKPFSTKYNLLWIAILLAVLLVGCRSEDQSPPTAGPSTAFLPTQAAPDPLVTVIVTRTPEGTPFFMPPPSNLDMQLLEGDWSLMMRYEINGSQWIDQIVYSTSAAVNIGLSGSVFGTGNFRFSATGETCALEAEEIEDFSFTVLGRFREDSSGIYFLDLTLTPTRDVVENYAHRCQNPDGTISEPESVEATILWPLLISTDQLHFSFPLDNPNRSWSIVQPDIPITVGGELLAEATLNAEVYFSR